MIDKKQFDDKVEALQQQLRAKLGIRGQSLQSQLSRAGRLLPKRIQSEGQILLRSQQKLIHPKLATQVDHSRVSKAFQAIETHLKTIDPKDRRKGKLLGWLGGLVFNLLLLVAVFVGLMRWQGIM